VKEQSPLSHII